MLPEHAPSGGLRDRANLLLIVLFLILAAATAVFSLRGYMRWKHGRLASEILTRAAQADIATAETALASLDPGWAGPDTIRRCRLAVWSVTSPERALAELDDALDTRPREWRVLAAEMAIRAGARERAAAIIADLRSASPDDPEAHFLAAWLAILQGDLEQGLAGLRELVAREPAHRGGAMLRARLLLESRDYTDVVRGRADLRLLSVGRDLLSLESLLTRAMHPRATDDPAERREAWQSLQEHPLAAHAYFMREPGTLGSLLASADGLPPALLLPFAQQFHRLAPDHPHALSSMVFFLQELRRHEEAAPLLTQLQARDPDGAAVLQLTCRQLILEQDPAAAVERLEQADPSLLASTRLAPLLGSLVDSTRQADPALRRRALELALRMPPDHLPVWLSLRRRALELLPERRAAIIAEVRSRIDEGSALAVAEWLIHAGEHEAAVELAQPLATGGSAPALMVAFEGLVATRRYAEAEALAAGLPADQPTGATLRARLALAQGDRSHAIALWRGAYDRARREHDEPAVLQLAAAAGRIGLHAEAAESFAQVADRIASGRLACDVPTTGTWLSVTLRLGSTRPALVAASHLATQAPAGTTLRAEGHFWQNYLLLLLNEDLLGAKEAARVLLETHPQDPRFRALFALAQTMTGQHSPALATLDRELAAEDPATLPVQVRVIGIAVCESNGRHELAARWRETLSGQALLPEEQALTAPAADGRLADLR